ncbi:MAG TPA: hypothetical protein VEI96_12155 [Thermodesulfovibrionales bacterium]|nr:hypothetical protein [Thermodesulfovibrionales bacterium]
MLIPSSAGADDPITNPARFLFIPYSRTYIIGAAVMADENGNIMPSHESRTWI